MSADYTQQNTLSRAMNHDIRQQVELTMTCDIIAHLISELPWYLEPNDTNVEQSFTRPRQGNTLSQTIQLIVQDMITKNHAFVEVGEKDRIFELFPVEPEYLSINQSWTPESLKDDCRWLFNREGRNEIELNDREIAVFPIDGNFDVTVEQLEQDSFRQNRQSLYKTPQDLFNNLRPTPGEDIEVLRRLINTGEEKDEAIIAIAQIIGKGINRILSNLNVTSVFKFGFRNKAEEEYWNERHEIAQLELRRMALFLGLGYEV